MDSQLSVIPGLSTFQRCWTDMNQSRPFDCSWFTLSANEVHEDYSGFIQQSNDNFIRNWQFLTFMASAVMLQVSVRFVHTPTHIHASYKLLWQPQRELQLKLTFNACRGNVSFQFSFTYKALKSPLAMTSNLRKVEPSIRGK